jgi:hypothetical protein
MPGHDSTGCRASIPQHARPPFHKAGPDELIRTTKATVILPAVPGEIDGGASEVVRAQDTRGAATEVRVAAE